MKDGTRRQVAKQRVEDTSRADAFLLEAYRVAVRNLSVLDLAGVQASAPVVRAAVRSVEFWLG